MAVSIPLTAQPRDTSMTPKALRRTRMIPGVVYGRETEATSLQFDAAALTRVVRQAGTSHIVALTVNGGTPQPTLIRDVQHDPVTGRVLHIDLYAIVAGQKIRSAVPLVQRGKSPALALGGVVSQVIDMLEVECLPECMPEVIEVDLSKLVDLHSRITVADLDISPEVTVHIPATTTVAHVMVQRMKIEAEVKEVAEAEVAPTEEAAAAAAGEATEQKES